MFAFWALSGLAAAGAALLILSFARKGEPASAPAPGQALSRELAELERLRDRGLLSAEAFDQARAEAARRGLAAAADDALRPPSPRDRLGVLAVAAVAVVGALGLSLTLGRPDLPDRPFARRVAEWSALPPPALTSEQAAAVLREEVRRRPGDADAWSALGAARFMAGDPLGAASAFRRALEIRPDDAQSWARLGETLVRAADGRIDGDAELAFRRAVELDPGQLGARYFLGELALQRGQLAEARALWDPVIAALAPADPRRVELTGLLAEAGA